MTLREEYQAYMSSISPAISDLPGDLKLMATVIDEHAPGYGVKIVMRWAEKFRGFKVHWCNLDALPDAKEYARSRVQIQHSDILPFTVQQIPSRRMRMLAVEAMQIDPKIGLNITLRVAWAYRETETLLHNIDGLLSKHRNDWILRRYQQNDVTASDIAAVVRLSPRRVEEILETGGETKKKDRRQTSLLDLL